MKKKVWMFNRWKKSIYNGDIHTRLSERGMLGYTWLLSTPGSHRKATHFFSFSFFYGFSSKVKKHPRVCFPSAGVYRRRSSVPWQWRCLSTGRPGLLPFCESVLIEPPKKMEKKRKNKTEKEGEKKNKTQKRGKIRKKTHYPRVWNSIERTSVDLEPRGPASAALCQCIFSVPSASREVNTAHSLAGRSVRLRGNTNNKP